MSEKSKGDTSRIVKNPLLSASVTGLTFEDFTNKPLLMPAAPLTSTTPDHAPVLLAEHSKCVTVGQKPEIDIETLSEINLNTSTDEECNQIYYSSNQKEKLEPKDESILGQAASSFSQLPTVASTVLSTFSKVIKDYSPSAPTKNYPKSDNGSYPVDQPTAPTLFDSNSNYSAKEHRLETPPLYSSSDVLLSTPVSTLPPLGTAQNNYRLGVKKKTYAQIPGLQINQRFAEENQYFNQINTNKTSSVETVANTKFETTTHEPVEQINTSQSAIKSSKELFSFSNLVPPVWESFPGITSSNTVEKSSLSAGDNLKHMKDTLDFPTVGDQVPQPSYDNVAPSAEENLTVSIQCKIDANFSDLTSASSTPSIRAPPPKISTQQTGGNTFRLQKGTRHYRSTFVDQIVPTIPPTDFSEVPLPIIPTNPCKNNSESLFANSTNFATPTTIAEPVKDDFHNVSNSLPNFIEHAKCESVNAYQTKLKVDHPQETNFKQQTPIKLFNPFETSDTTLDGNLQTISEEASSVPRSKDPVQFNANNQQQTANKEVNFYPVSVQEDSSIISSFSKPSTAGHLPWSSKTDIGELLNEKQLPENIHSLRKEVAPAEYLNIFPSERIAVSNKKHSNLDDASIATKNSPTSPPSFLQESLNQVHQEGTLLDVENCSSKDKQKVFLNTNQRTSESGDLFLQPSEENIGKNYILSSNTFSCPENVTSLKANAPHEIGDGPSLKVTGKDAQGQNIVSQIQHSVSDTSYPEHKSVFPLEASATKTHILSSFPEGNYPHGTKGEESVNKIEPSSFSLSNYFNKRDNSSSQQTETPKPARKLADVSNQATCDRQKESNILTNITSHENLTNYFGNQIDCVEKPTTFETLPNSAAFFDSFHQDTDLPNCEHIENNSNDISKSLRIQDFFNNPPLNSNATDNDLQYKLVGSGLRVDKDNNLGAQSPYSNVVEPPSSSCSDFSSEFTQNFDNSIKYLPNEILEELQMAGLLGTNMNTFEAYVPVSQHWFYKRVVDTKHIWTPFSHIDSQNLERNFISEDGKVIVAVEGGRYDVNIPERSRVPVYWSGEPTEVRRCSWFYKGFDSKYVPYEENIASLLEQEYKEASESGQWHKKISLPTGETVVFHGPTVMVHFLVSQLAADVWTGTTQASARPRIVKRDKDDFNIEVGELEKVDHLLFMVHGVGSACDLRFRSLEEVVDEFRSIAIQLIQSHYNNSCKKGLVGRVEVLPVSWHSQLHSGESGIDEKLKAITLESIPKLRNFTNDTLLDILFYTSPIFCQGIMSTVAEAINKIYIKYCQRNPKFNGGVSLAGHSLGSLILFDLLCHQKPSEEMEIPNSENPDQMVQPLQFSSNPSLSSTEQRSQQVSYTIGHAGTGQPYINYPQLIFHPKKFFALGSPIGMFVTIRGIDTLGLDFKFPTCTNFFHIFHPYDPVAYRIEALINPDLSSVRPVLIPHHKGRKRMHLELKETMTRVGADLKQKIVDTVKSTFDSVNFLSSKTNNISEATEATTKETVTQNDETQLQLHREPSRSRTNSTSTPSDMETNEIDLPLGKLNDNRRIDYVLQEAPLEFFNEYLFAFASHVCYWDSEDTILFIMKEIYSSLDIQTDSQIPQQGMIIERPNSRLNTPSSSPNK